MTAKEAADSVKAYLAPFAIAILGAVALGYFGWLGVEVSGHGAILAKIEDRLENFGTSVGEVKNTLSTFQKDTEGKFGEIVRVQSEEQAEAARVGQALKDRDAIEDKRAAGGRPEFP